MPNLYVILEGGFVTGICSDDPAALAGLNVSVIDYDTEHYEEHQLCAVVADGGTVSPAKLSGLDIEQARFTLKANLPKAKDAA